MTKEEDAALRAEWQRAQGMGRRLGRERLLATLAGMAVIALGFLIAFLLYWFWPFSKIPLWILGAPIVSSLPIGWWARNRLWPGGQFG